MIAIPHSERAIAGYIMSVLCAVIVLVLAALLFTPGFFLHRAVEILVLGSILSVVATIFGFAFTLIPCVVLAIATERLGIRSWTFYVVCGVALGLLALPATELLSTQFSWYTDPDAPAATNWCAIFKRAGPVFASAGGIAGMVYWKIAGRHRRRQP
jgi:hypothetical protein